MIALDLFIAIMGGAIAFFVALIIAALFEAVGLAWWWLALTYAVIFALYMGYRSLRDRYGTSWVDRLFPETANPEGDRTASLASIYAVGAGFIIAFVTTRVTPASDIMALF
ncbi:hypothetical protein GQ651_11160 [Alphaproteobacteria bacterium GH1-50]|uniref:Uncharacterized protein n=1 Tax=Kangsaoukella pontilimi TaxID=2691042 RepID=A0A7C9ISX9_9RHOB|nr:hypothetical protein [Kangsaoukella pontilimi]MXQ08405.1 hypothetical protein [Kangsaoukella pontilimi]